LTTQNTLWSATARIQFFLSSARSPGAELNFWNRSAQNKLHPLQEKEKEEEEKRKEKKSAHNCNWHHMFHCCISVNFKEVVL